MFEAMWRTLKAANLQLAHGDLHAIAVRQVVRLTNPTMSAANDTVTALGQQATDSSVDPAYARTINLAGRQRMLTQRAAKDFCLAALNVGGDEARKRLAKSVELFETTMHSLMNGLDGLVEPPNILIDAQLDRTLATWNKLAPIFREVIEGRPVSEEQMVLAGELSDKALAQMNAAVQAYASN